jgi:hypothetical protein
MLKGGKPVIVPKVIVAYEKVFQVCSNSNRLLHPPIYLQIPVGVFDAGFWDELFLLRPRPEAIVERLQKSTGSQLLHSKVG